MSSILDKAKEHYAGIETKDVKIPEWGLTIFWRPWNLDEREKVWGAVKASGKDTQLSARVLITKALNAEGKRIFGLEHLRELCFEVDSAVVERVAMAIIGEQPAAEDIIKN